MASSIKGTTKETLSNTITDVAEAFMRARTYGLEIEVFTTALLFLKENPESTVEKALQVGLGDWDV